MRQDTNGQAVFARVARLSAIALTFIAVLGAPASAQNARDFMVGTWSENWSATMQGRQMQMVGSNQFGADGSWSGSGTVSNGTRTESFAVHGTWSAQMRADGRIEVRNYCNSGDCGNMPSSAVTMDILDNDTLRNPQLPAQVLRRRR